MKEDAWDTLLIRLAVLAPLVLVLVSGWQASLVGWYVPWDDASGRYFDEGLAQQVQALPEVSAAPGATLLLVTDRDCACTRPTLRVLQESLAKSPRKDLRLQVIDINDAAARTPAWQRVLRQLPATPTLLITQGDRLMYAGPVNAGKYCTTRVQQVLGLSALESSPQRPVVNWLQQGCYCRLKHTAAAP